MAEAVEHHIVALLGQQHGPSRQLNPEPTAHQEKQGRAFLAGHPLRALIALRVNSPLDLYLVTVPCITLGLEMAQPLPRLSEASAPAFPT
jgi:hypothetical protein